MGEDVAAAVVLRAGASVGEEQLRDHLIEILPAHEVPSRILFVESLPRVATGKLRRRGLADRLAARLRSSGSPARGEMEQLVEDTFTTVLGVDCSGRDANFFMLGGDSLSSLDVINRLEHAIGIELNVAMLFLHPTVRTLAAEIEPLLAEEEARLPRAAGLRFDAPSGLFDRIARLQSLRTEAHPRAIPVAESWPEVGPPGCEVFPASFAQSRLWFLHQLEPGLTAYHLVSLWHLRGILDRSALQQALAGLIERHPVLRTSFRLRGDMVQQIIHPPFPLPLTPDRLGGRSVDAFVDDWLRKDQSTPFDLESGVLLRARLLEISHDEHLLLLNHHHIASDGWSRNVLCEDLSEFYNAACEDRAPVLPALCLHYQDYAVWQRERISGPRAEGLRLEGMDSAGNERGALLQRSREELEATRYLQLEEQQDTLRRLLAKSEQWLAFERDPFRQALNVSLELLGVSGLEPHTDERGQPCWRLADPEALVSQTRDISWDTTLDSLRGVKPAKAFVSDWRRDNPVRPVIFSDPGRLSAEAVHLHLEHRLVQRLLSRFLAQGFLHHELKRACVVPCRDPQPRLIVLGRLSLFGEGAARLHDELIMVMADWHPGADRQQALQPVGGEQRQAVWALLPQLQQEADRALADATGLLQERGRLEADALKSVLRNQRQRINTTLRQRTRKIAKLDRKAAQAEPTPLITGLADVVNIPELDPASMSERERRQLASDQKHWQRRLETIETELSSEPKRIEASYKVVTHRLEPAGLVYLWPISG